MALSGGGIRAAAFSLGVMQALNENDPSDKKAGPTLFDEFDYLSTVSGGGYAGAAVTWFRHLSNPKVTCVEAKDKKALKTFPKPGKHEPKDAADKALDFIRYRKNHLTPTFALNALSLLGVVLQTAILSFPIYIAPLIIILLFYDGLARWFFLALSKITFIEPFIQSLRVAAGWFVGCAPHSSSIPFECACESGALMTAALLALFAVLLVLLNLAFLFCSRIARRWKHHYRFRRVNQRSIGLLLALMIAMAALWLAESFRAILQFWGVNDVISLIVAVLSGNAVGAFSFRSLLTGGAKNKQNRAKIVIVVVATILLVLNLAAAHEIAKYLLQDFAQNRLAFSLAKPWPWLIMGITVISIAAGLWTNLNYVSLNRMYRDRLMETFMPDLRTVHAKTVDDKATKADSSFLFEMKQRPYHLVNAHVVLTSSKRSPERERTGDNFILSPLYCGSCATGYARTKDFGIRGGRDGKGGMTLATAMAISGAAFNPRVGPGGWDTPINNPIISSMLSYYNLRLGCWVVNPRKDDRDKERWPHFYREGVKGLLNLSVQENAAMVELTDGGHFENTGLYELLRRRTDVIVLSDATADGDFNFKDLGIAIERARADLGVDIRFRNSDWDLTHLMPGSSKKKHYDKRYGLARRGFAVATIKYPDLRTRAERREESETKKCGGATAGGYCINGPCLFYIKAVMTRKLPGDLYGYRGAFDEFPYQPISDQMFDESQFDAYRELGYQHAKSMRKELGCTIKEYLEES